MTRRCYLTKSNIVLFLLKRLYAAWSRIMSERPQAPITFRVRLFLGRILVVGFNGKQMQVTVTLCMCVCVASVVFRSLAFLFSGLISGSSHILPRQAICRSSPCVVLLDGIKSTLKASRVRRNSNRNNINLAAIRLSSIYEPTEDPVYYDLISYSGMGL